jgi:Na+/proline symporter
MESLRLPIFVYNPHHLHRETNMDVIFISLTIIFLTIILYLWVGYRSQVTKPDISRFFLYGHKLPTVEFFSTVSSSSISLGGAILAFLSLGYYSPWVAVIATASWLLGFLFHYRFMRMVFSSHSEVRERTFTLHSYLGHFYPNFSCQLRASQRLGLSDFVLSECLSLRICQFLG